MSSLAHDLRFAVRQLRKSPGFAALTILTLALGIGATTAIFSLVNAVLLRPLPFPEQDRLLWLDAEIRSLNGAGIEDSISYPDFFDWRRAQHSFDAIAAYRGDSLTLTGVGDARELTSATVTCDFFRVLGVRPLLGRDLEVADEKADAHVVMLSYELWKSSFGGVRDIAGRAIMLDGKSFSVAGVMPAGFSFPIQNPPIALWTSAGDDSQFFPQRGAGVLAAVGRLKPGATLEQAKADMNVIAHNLSTQYPATNKTHDSVLIRPLLEQLVGDNRPALRILFGAVALVLLIACANVAGLLLARATRRRPQIALQAALGASPGGIIRQILIESLCLSIAAGALGIALSAAAVKWLPRFVPKSLPRLDQVSIDGTVLAFALAASILTGLIFGVLPAWRMSRFDPLDALRDGSRSLAGSRSRYRLQSWLVIAETALGLVLLVGSGLLIRSFVRVLNVNPGFDSQHVLTADISVPHSRYSRQQRIDFYHRLFARLAALPGVESVSAGFPLPLSANNIDISITIEGRPVPSGEEPSERMAVVTPDFFRTLRIPILAGRPFTQVDDTNGKPVIIINDRFARKYFPGENPIGKHIQSGVGDGTVKAPMREVVGVVGNVKELGPTADAPVMYYLPWEQAVITAPALAIRTAQDPPQLIAPLRAQISEMDRQVPLYRVATLDESAYRAAAEPRFQTLLLSSFAAMALLLSSVGLYALLSYMVVQRSAEIGIRMALGAQHSDVLGLILGRGLALAVTGAIIGLAAAVVLTDYLTKLLFTIKPLDGVAFASVTALLLVVSLISSSIPAYRAARLDPMKMLRDQ